MVLEETWQKWLERLYNLQRAKTGSHEPPHKPVLLLSIFDLLDRGMLSGNAVPLSDELIETFKRYFDTVRQEDDQPTIENPFFRLSEDGFWQLVPDRGGPLLFQAGNVGGTPPIDTLQATHGEFDVELWTNLMASDKTRQQLREGLIARYFPEFRDKLAAMLGIESIKGPRVLVDEPPRRDAAFSHTILELYDYRCTACGVRVKLSNDLTLVEAAHIVPFAESRSDKPDNGLALCPNHHWAMDRFLIAPCPDKRSGAGVWRVTDRLDARVDNQKDLLDLNGRPVLMPLEEKFYPAAENLKWRETKLMGKD